MQPPLSFPWKSALRLGTGLTVLALTAPDAPAASWVPPLAGLYQPCADPPCPDKGAIPCTAPFP